MRSQSPDLHPQGSFFDITHQLDSSHPLLALAKEIDWQTIEENLSKYYSHKGRKAKPIRLMVGLLMLKQLYKHSDEGMIEQWQMNPYYQVFCGQTEFQTTPPCHPTELVKFRNRIGEQGIEKVFAESVRLHGTAAEENKVIVDTTVQEKAITYPTDSKLAIKIINRLNKLAKQHGIKQRRTFVKEVKSLRLACRHFRHVKRRAKAKKALKRLRTITGKLLRELQRKLPESILEQQQANFELYQKVLNQQIKDKNKIYSLHEPDIYCIGKGKDHKPYEYGRKASIVTTLKNQVIIGVVSHDKNQHDSDTLKPALEHAMQHRKKAIKQAIVDRGYRGAKNKVEQDVLLPSPPLKKDSQWQRQNKRKLCRRRAAIEPVIGHLKQDYRLTRNWLKGSHGDQINLLMAACAWNLNKWIKQWIVLFFSEKSGNILGLLGDFENNKWIYFRINTLKY